MVEVQYLLVINVHVHALLVTPEATVESTTHVSTTNVRMEQLLSQTEILANVYVHQDFQALSVKLVKYICLNFYKNINAYAF